MLSKIEEIMDIEIANAEDELQNSAFINWLKELKEKLMSTDQNMENFERSEK